MSPLCPVMDSRCPASLVPGAAGGGAVGYAGVGYNNGGYAPYANGGMGMANMGSQCPATAYAGGGGGGGGGGRSMRSSPCTAAILERERKERERQEREIRERMEKERIERERKELERRERDLKAREPYMCPGQAQIEKAALKQAKKAHLAGKSPNTNVSNGNRNGYGDLCEGTNGNGGGYGNNRTTGANSQDRFGPCVPVGDLAPCDRRACPASADNNDIPVHEVKSRELRGGVLYTGCDCNRRNGLQHDCKRSLCQGRPECLTKPWPMCIPSGGPGYISPCYPVCEPPCWDEPVRDRYY